MFWLVLAASTVGLSQHNLLGVGFEPTLSLRTVESQFQSKFALRRQSTTRASR